MYALVDCNNFFVSCERIFRPELALTPVAVLSDNDGCIIARSNEVKALGIAMGVPLFKVKPIVRANAVTLFSANFELYGDISQRIISLLGEETPLIEVYSIDECFLDISQLPIASYDDWARMLRTRIGDEIGIPVSIGVAPTKTLAKVASTYAKTHDGAYVVNDEAHRQRLVNELPIEEIWGVGRRLAPKLRDKGIAYAGQLTVASDAWLEQQFTITGMRMVRELRGEACLPFGDTHDSRKSIMRSRSFGHKVRALHQLESAVATFAAQAAARLRAQDSLCRSLVVYLSTGKHAEQQRRVSTVVRLDEVTSDTAAIIAAAIDGLAAVYDPEFAYMKAGVILLDIVPVAEWQLSLLHDEGRRDERMALMQAIDGLNRRYGPVVYHATERPKNEAWHSRRELRSPRYTTQWGELPGLRVA